MSRIIRLCGLIYLLLCVCVTRHAPQWVCVWVCVFMCECVFEEGNKRPGCCRPELSGRPASQPKGLYAAPRFQELVKIAASTCKICGIYEMKSRWHFKRSRGFFYLTSDFFPFSSPPSPLHPVCLSFIHRCKCVFIVFDSTNFSRVFTHG